MFNAVFSFEVRQQWKKPFTWIFLLLMILQGLYYMHHAGEFYSADKTYSNAPAILYTVLAGMGYIGFIVTAILGGTALGKDLDYRTSALLYGTGVSEMAFFSGRYAGSFAVLFLLYAGYLAGIVLYSYLPVPNLGPFSWTVLARGILLIFLPNVFVLYSLCVAVSVFTKSSKSAYGVALAGMLLMIFAETSFDSNPNVVLADPTGFSVLHNQLQHLSPLEKNNFSPAFSGLLLYNRFIWVGFSLIMLLLAGRRFSFAEFGSAGSRKSKTRTDQEEDPAALPDYEATGLSKAKQRDASGGYGGKIFSLSWLEFKSVTRSLGFRLFLSLILIIYICYIAVWQQQYYSAAPTLPVTLEITGVTLPLSFYFLLFLIINTTELLFRNNTSGFWQIADALPVPTWVTVLSKITAMLAVAVLMTFCLMGFGMLVQVAKGYYHFETGVYFRELFVRWIPKYLLYILLTVFVAGLTANRYATHWICIVLLVVSTILHEIEIIEQHRFNFMFSPGSGLSTDMNGSSIFAAAHSWFMAYWFSLSLAMLAIGLWLWPRGIPVSPGHRARSRKINPVFLVMLLAGITGFLFCGNRIYRIVNVQNKFQTKAEQRAGEALYEKTYKRYQHYPQPLIQNIILNLDLYPESRKLRYSARLLMRNRSALPIDTLHVERMDFSILNDLAVEGYALTLVKQDTVLRHNIYRLDHSILPGDSIACDVTGSLQYQGFTNDDPQKELTFNGSFLSHDLIPFFGYDDRRELKSNQNRVQYGLPKLVSRLPDTADASAARQFFASTQANRISYTFTVSTSTDQTIVAPGMLEKDWRSGGRHYSRFSNEKPALFDFFILSARYAVKKQRVDISGKPVDIEVYYHPGHNRNIEHLIASAKEAWLIWTRCWVLILMLRCAWPRDLITMKRFMLMKM
jgi:ABC-type transport system involved in multi-copper enzyme maturation permease subunit